MTDTRHALRTHDPSAATRPAAQAQPVRILQRKCDCGTHTGGGGSCGPCADKKKKVQRRAIGEAESEIPHSVENILQSPGKPLDPGIRASMESRFGADFSRVRVHADTHAAASAHDIHAAAYTSGTHIVFGDRRYEPHTARGRHLLAHELAHVMQQSSGPSIATGIGPADDIHERAADRAADAVVAQGPVFTPPAIVPAPRPAIRRQRDDAEPPAPTQQLQALIVDDSVTPMAGQVRRREFADELDAAICATSRMEMGRLGRSTEGCPLLEQWRPRIRSWNAAQLEQAMRRWIGEGEPVRTARDYIPRVTARLAEGIRLWGATGRIANIPPDLMALLGGTIRVGIGSMIRGAIGGLFRKSRDGAAAPTADVVLDGSAARPLDTGTASRMGSALGADFSGVRIHTGAAAAESASRLNARAFTVGRDVAFAEGEYRPGTILGDALLAHELAHVAQQGGAEGPLLKTEGESGALESDADDAAVHAVVSLWPGVRRYARGLRANAGPRLKSGLQLQRCPKAALVEPDPNRTTTREQAAARGTGCDATERNTADSRGRSVSCCTRTMLSEIYDLHPEAIARVDKAIEILGDPEKASKYNVELQRHFRITSPHDSVILIRSTFTSIRDKMTGGAVQFDCRSRYTDSLCRRQARGGGEIVNYAQTGISPTGEAAIQFCGDYEESVTPGAAAGTSPQGPGPTFQGRELRGQPDHRFLFPRTAENAPPEERTHNGWVRTLIHEYAHVVGIPGGDEECYRTRRGDYPCANPLQNADSYAWFAVEITRI